MYKFRFLTHFAMTAKCTCLIGQMQVHIAMGIQGIQETKTGIEKGCMEIQT